jgi:hypothetical protein
MSASWARRALVRINYVPFNDPGNFEPVDASGDIQMILTGGKGTPVVLHLHVGTHAGNSSSSCFAAGDATGQD